MTRIYKSLMIFILLVHHFSFMLIYLVESMGQKFGRNLAWNSSCKISGLIVIFTILCGGLAEVLHFLLKNGYKIFKNIKKCFVKKKSL